jgi:predicted extracellular nuclease
VRCWAPVGVIDYSFNNPKLEVIETPALTLGGLPRENTKPQSNNQLAVSTFNVENLAPGDPKIKFERLAGQVVNNLKSPDILGLEEIQDKGGAANDGTVDSTQTTDKLIDGKPHLALNLGRITPTNAAWDSSRKPLAGEFTFRGKTVFVIANHLSSKGGDDPLFGKWQQPVRFSEDARHLQATEIRSFLDLLLRADKNANVVVLGDINDFEFSQTVDIMVGSGANAIVDLPRMLPLNERYSYVYEGNSQVLDQILISKSLTIAPPGAMYPTYDYDIVHTNSEFYDQDSDHDPQVVRLALRGGIG